MSSDHELDDEDTRDAPSPSNLAFDPDQDRHEKREIRKQYREKIKQAEDDRANIGTVSVDELITRLDDMDKIFNKVKAPQEATLDSRLLLIQSDMGAQKARAMKHDAGGFDTDDFISKLITFMGGRKAEMDDDGNDVDDDGDDTLDWERIGWKAIAKSRRVPVMDFMLGPLSIEQKKRQQGGRRARLEKNKEEEVRPQELNEEDIVRAENETAKNVYNIGELLYNQDGSVNLFKFIVNPTSFGQTVENLFYLSFLIRDAKCSLEIIDDEPMITSVEPPTEEMYAEGLRKRQVVMELDEATWRRAIEVFDIKEPMIPTRKIEDAKTRLGGKWSG